MRSHARFWPNPEVAPSLWPNASQFDSRSGCGQYPRRIHIYALTIFTDDALIHGGWVGFCPPDAQTGFNYIVAPSLSLR
jgi:hypothetical protein